MTVKRYTPTQCCEHDGTYVTYSDYQKLVAENAALNERNKNSLKFIAEELGDPEFSVESVQTPNTDAAIAEIKAQGVDSLSLYMELNGYSNEASGAREFAAYLRAGRKG